MGIFKEKRSGHSSSHHSHSHESNIHSRAPKRIDSMDEISPELFKRISDEILHGKRYSDFEETSDRGVKEPERSLIIEEDFDVDEFLAEYTKNPEIYQ